MCKKKTVFRIKGLILQSDLIQVMGLIPGASHMFFTTTFRDKREERQIALGKKSASANFHKYGHIEIRDSDKEHLKAIYQAILPYMVRNYTHDFVWTCSCAS